MLRTVLVAAFSGMLAAGWEKAMCQDGTVWKEDTEDCFPPVCNPMYSYINKGCKSCYKKCKEACKQGGTDEDAKTCTSITCTDSNCLMCEENEAGKCLHCLGGYSLKNDGTCVQCNAPCKACEDGGELKNLQTCKVCEDGKRLEGSSCEDCTLKNCKTCSTDKGTCDSCEDGYSLVGDTCTKCDDNCKTCGDDNAKRCLTCNEDWTVWLSKCVDPKLVKVKIGADTGAGTVKGDDKGNGDGDDTHEDNGQNTLSLNLAVFTLVAVWHSQ